MLLGLKEILVLPCRRRYARVRNFARHTLKRYSSRTQNEFTTCGPADVSACVMLRMAKERGSGAFPIPGPTGSKGFEWAGEASGEPGEGTGKQAPGATFISAMLPIFSNHDC